MYRRKKLKKIIVMECGKAKDIFTVKKNMEYLCFLVHSNPIEEFLRKVNSCF